MGNKLYILTITKNDIAGLIKTIKSIEGLKTNLKIIHIIKNAKHKKTSKIIREIVVNNQNRILIDTNDNGIYDAMNKAIEYVPSGEMFMFINSGDIICGELYNNFEDKAYLLNAYLNSNKSKLIKKIVIKNNYNCGMPFNHQSLICRKENDMKFDANFKISADYLFVLKWISSKYKTPRLIPILSSSYIVFDGTGISSNKKVLRDFEGLKAIILEKGIFSILFYCISRLLSFPRYIFHKFGIDLD